MAFCIQWHHRRFSRTVACGVELGVSVPCCHSCHYDFVTVVTTTLSRLALRHCHVCHDCHLWYYNLIALNRGCTVTSAGVKLAYLRLSRLSRCPYRKMLPCLSVSAHWHPCELWHLYKQSICQEWQMVTSVTHFHPGSIHTCIIICIQLWPAVD